MSIFRHYGIFGARYQGEQKILRTAIFSIGVRSDFLCLFFSGPGDALVLQVTV